MFKTLDQKELLVFNKFVGRSSIAKTLDQLILPVVIFVGARYLGIFLPVLFSQVEFQFSLDFNLISVPFIEFVNFNNLLFLNSFSWLLTAAVFGVVFSFIAFRSLHLNEDWLHPKEASRLHKRKLDHFTISPEEAYPQVLAWSLVTLVALNLSIVDFLSGAISTVVFGVGVAINALLVALFVLSLGRGLEREKV
ncbi:MAG: hypothetical protein WD187_03960 [Candidatus Woykebacteria bacterium]